ncbi:MAG: hypothetical protein U9O20_04035 [Patescibacteria group bacterium]|nr:hypothetical protein [Patescibacteria group bacterium]
MKKLFKSFDPKVIKTTPTDHDRQAAKSLSFVRFPGRALGEMKIDKQKISSMCFERIIAVNEIVTNDTWQFFLTCKDMIQIQKMCEINSEKVVKK